MNVEVKQLNVDNFDICDDLCFNKIYMCSDK